MSSNIYTMTLTNIGYSKFSFIRNKTVSKYYFILNNLILSKYLSYNSDKHNLKQEAFCWIILSFSMDCNTVHIAIRW